MDIITCTATCKRKQIECQSNVCWQMLWFHEWSETIWPPLQTSGQDTSHWYIFTMAMRWKQGRLKKTHHLKVLRWKVFFREINTLRCSMPYIFYSPVQIYAKFVFFTRVVTDMKNIKILRFSANIQRDLLSRLNARRPCLPPFDAVPYLGKWLFHNDM